MKVETYGHSKIKAFKIKLINFLNNKKPVVYYGCGVSLNDVSDLSEEEQ